MKIPRKLYWLVFASLLIPYKIFFGCGPFFVSTVFVEKTHPDFPLERFAAGNLGVVQPTWWRWYLYAAYRQLEGAGFNSDEQHALLATWNQSGGGSPPGPGSPEVIQAAIQVWMDERARVAAAPPGRVDAYYTHFGPGQYIAFLNCHGDAFRNAARTLDDRIRTFGATSSEIKDWVAAQDSVFANCSDPRPFRMRAPGATQGAEPASLIPPPAPAGWPPVLTADRNYQIAAANFYARNFDVADQQFESIAADETSPWHDIAPYLAARTLLRKGTVTVEPGKLDKDALKQAQDRLEAILANPRLSGMHEDARRLLGFVQTKLDPEGRIRELGRALLRKNSAETLGQNLKDYEFLIVRYPSPEPSGDDLTDWIETIKLPGNTSLAHAVKRWKETNSQAWLVAAISNAEPSSSQTPALISAAEEVAPKSAAFWTVNYHAVRLMIGMGKLDEARAKLGVLLARPDLDSSVSARNLLLGERMAIAKNLDEFLRFAPRRISHFGYEDGEELGEVSPDNNPLLKSMAADGTAFDTDSAGIFNRSFPLELLAKSAKSQLLTQPLQRRVALAAWTRAFVLGDERVAAELFLTVEDLDPELKPYLDAYAAEKNPLARKFDGAFLVFKFPGLQPYVRSSVGRMTPLGQRDDLRENWWCPLTAEMDASNYWKMAIAPVPPGGGPDKQPRSVTPSFLSAELKNDALREQNALASVPCGSTFLGRIALARAKSHPDDPRVPEALHLAVIAPRVSCSDKESGQISHAAFDLLHQRYPDNPWTKRTNFWFR